MFVCVCVYEGRIEIGTVLRKTLQVNGGEVVIPACSLQSTYLTNRGSKAGQGLTFLGT